MKNVFDKNGDELFIGASVSVDSPTTKDMWNFEFSGIIIRYVPEENYLKVEDGDGNVWCVEPEKLELE